MSALLAHAAEHDAANSFDQRSRAAQPCCAACPSGRTRAHMLLTQGADNVMCAMQGRGHAEGVCSAQHSRLFVHCVGEKRRTEGMDASSEKRQRQGKVQASHLLVKHK